MTWTQVYDPLGHWWLSTLVAAIPVIVLLGALALLHLKAHWAALLGLATSLLIAIKVFHMPVGMGARAAVFGLAYGAFPNRMDHSECHFHVRHELCDWAVQSPARKLNGHNAGSPLAAVANRVFLRSFF